MAKSNGVPLNRKLCVSRTVIQSRGELVGQFISRSFSILQNTIFCIYFVKKIQFFLISCSSLTAFYILFFILTFVYFSHYYFFLLNYEQSHNISTLSKQKNVKTTHDLRSGLIVHVIAFHKIQRENN